MFDCNFFKAVQRILEWAQPPPRPEYANIHQVRQSRYRAKFSEVMHQKIMTESVQSRLLSIYVSQTYPPYFGLVLHATYFKQCRSGIFLD